MSSASLETISSYSGKQPINWSKLDWYRLARPQPDQYDTEVILRLASTTTSPGRPRPYRRTPVGNSPATFDGQVAIRYACRALPDFPELAARYPDAARDHKNISAAAEYIRTWPAAFAQCQRLLDSLHPATDPQTPLESTEIYRGSVCHSWENLFGAVWATIFCPLGLAQAIVREMAHQKLRVLDGSLAFLHPHYSHLYATELDLHILKTERNPARAEALRAVLERDLARLEEGRPGIQSSYEREEPECDFIQGVADWTDKAIAAASEVLGRAVAAAATRPMPWIDTSANTLRTPDREVEVLLTFAAPRIVLLGNVVSDEECDYLTRHAEPRLARSSVVADAAGTVKVHESRTSKGVMLRPGETEIIARIEARLAAIANWPLRQAEGLQILRYGPADEYRPHFDWMDPAMPGLRRHLEHGGQRLATFVLYLSDVESGGGTSFPAVGLEVMPRKGAAVFFLNTDARHVPDQLTLHAGSPVIKGVKFVANKWLREREC